MATSNFRLLATVAPTTRPKVVQGFVDERVRWFDLLKAPGYGYTNRNIALRRARGELVAFMAHDDLWLPDHLEHRFAPPTFAWGHSSTIGAQSSSAFAQWLKRRSESCIVEAIYF